MEKQRQPWWKILAQPRLCSRRPCCGRLCFHRSPNKNYYLVLLHWNTFEILVEGFTANYRCKVSQCEAANTSLTYFQNEVRVMCIEMVKMRMLRMIYPECDGQVENVDKRSALRCVSSMTMNMEHDYESYSLNIELWVCRWRRGVRECVPDVRESDLACLVQRQHQSCRQM